MRKRLVIASLCIAATSCLLGSVSGALAWFVEKATVSSQDGLVGESQGAYFARGDGSSGSPYIINKPIHLYNLAWLQYIGYFNDDGAPYYFALDPEDDITTLDMDGWVLPPIGTSLYPFLGNFEGNSETIANLTTDNVIGEEHIVKKPTFITDAAKDSNGILKTYKKATNSTSAEFLSQTVNTVGMFGIIGEYDGMAEVGADYASANSINFLALDNLTVKSGSSSTLVGLAVGYDNATLNGVAINNSNLYAADGATSISPSGNLSDYSLVGYATDTALSKCFVREDTASLPKINNPNTESGGQNWGGSIDMLQMYTQLAEIRDASSGTDYIPATQPFEYVTSETYVNGVKDDSLTTTSTDNRTDQDNHRYEGNKFAYNDPDAGNPTYASFTFARELDSSFTSYEDGESASPKYNCLYGEKTFSGFTKTVYEGSPESRDGFYIHTADGVYMNNNGGTIESGSLSDGPTVWYRSGDYIYSQSGATDYYLYCYSGRLSLATNNASSWTYDSTYETFTTSTSYWGSTTYYYIIYSSQWTVTSTSSVSYYYISSSNYYLNATVEDGTPTLAAPSTTLTELGHWTYSNSRFSITIDGTVYYLKLDTDTYPYTPILESGTSGYFFTRNSGYVRCRVSGNNYYYLKISNGAWAAQTGNSNRATCSTGSTPIDFNITTTATTGTYINPSSSSSQSTSYTTYDTYFPLLMEPDTYKPMNQYVDPDDASGQKKFNTGYVVSGCNDTTSRAYQQVWGDIRVSAFPYSSLSNTTTIRTRTYYLDGADSTDSGWQAMTSVNDAAALKLQKYTSSHSKLVDLLSDSQSSGFIHGLHFMSAQISKQNLVEIGRAVVLDGKTPQVLNDKGVYEDRASVYDNYQVPEDSIDFNLKSYGYINFYAGTYFQSNGESNDCFFSLHQVTRDANNDIDTINEITEVYGPNYKDSSNSWKLGDEDHPYIYKYAGTPTTWSLYTKVDDEWTCTTTETEPDHGPLLFDCSWITNPDSLTDDVIYYFEIPVNSGEYALGSVSGGMGAYLMYLDIGSGAANYKDVEQNETIVISITELVFPKGIDFVDFSNNTAALDVAAAGGNSATVAINPTDTAIATAYTYATNATTKKSTLSLTKAGNDPPDMAASTFELDYASESVTASYLTTALDLPDATYTITMEKEIIQNYNPNTGTGTLTYTYVEKFTITNGTSGRKIQLPNAGGDSAEWRVTSGSVSCAAGLVTFTGTGTAVVQSTWTSSTEIGEASNWTPLSSNNAEGVETSPIVKFHFMDYTSSDSTPPNVVVTYTYTGTKNASTGAQSFVYNISVVNNSGKDVVLVIDALKTAFNTEAATTYTVTITYNGATYDVTAAGNTFTITSSN